MQAGTSTKIVVVDTSRLSASSAFSLCYTEDVGDETATWVDSGLRIFISKVASLNYGSPIRNMPSTNVAPGTNTLPQVTGITWTYQGDLGTAKWMSLVDSTLNSNNPCVVASVASAAEDSTHSGEQQALAGTRRITFPQSQLLNETKLFAVCYAETDGGDTDSTWRDSYVRVTMSKIEKLESLGEAGEASSR